MNENEIKKLSSIIFFNMFLIEKCVSKNLEKQDKKSLLAMELNQIK